MTPRASLLGRWLREPLLLFLLLGALVFVAQAFGGKPDPRTIVVPRGLQGEELETWKLEEAAHREALTLGLGRDDPQVLAILKQRIVAARSTPTPEPTEADLARWLESHRDAFELPERFDFDQIFFDTRRPNGESRARELLPKLPAEGPFPDAGDAFRFGNSLRNQSLPRVRSVFGSAFADRLRALEPERWQLVSSTEGIHLVRLLTRSPPSLPPLQDVRAALTDAWKRDHEAATDRRILRALLDRYRFVTAP